MRGRTAVQGDQESDESRLLRAIYEAQVTVVEEKFRKYTVSELLTKYQGPDQESALRGVGLRIMDPKAGAGMALFIVQEPVREQLLRGSDWQHMQIRQILLRIDGAYPVQQRMGGHRPWGVAIPMKSITQLIGGTAEPEEPEKQDTVSHESRQGIF
jgi:hypothetical protein